MVSSITLKRSVIHMDIVDRLLTDFFAHAVNDQLHAIFLCDYLDSYA